MMPTLSFSLAAIFRGIFVTQPPSASAPAANAPETKN
jgi:hypothetical protein